MYANWIKKQDEEHHKMRVYRRRRNRRHQELSVLEKRYIGDPAVIEEKIDSVANQGKAK